MCEGIVPSSFNWLIKNWFLNVSLSGLLNDFPQGGFEPPQADPESAVLPLHNRGMCCFLTAIPSDYTLSFLSDAVKCAYRVRESSIDINSKWE